MDAESTPPADPPLVCVLGPTASGKTQFSLALAEECGGEIVVMDSAQIYRGLQIGSAKPSTAELARVPHHLLGVQEWTAVCSAAQWAQQARIVCAEIWARGRWPIICGGTFLYLRALLSGLHALPTDDPALRARLQERVRQEGSAALHAELQAQDPDTAALIHPHDTQRTVRALEILAQTGRGREAWLRRETARPWSGPVLKFALLPGDREQLRLRIAQRFQQMLDEGLWEEVRSVRADPSFDPQLPVLKAVGYRQLFMALAGECSASEAVEKAIIATRQYAKRQLTWLRREPDLHWLDSSDPAHVHAGGALFRGWSSRIRSG